MGSFIKQPVRLTLISFSTILLTMVLFTSATAQEGDDSELLQQGAQVFAENCAACHGEDGQGRIGATLAKNWSSIRPDLQIQDTIERAINIHYPFSKLGEAPFYIGNLIGGVKVRFRLYSVG